MTSFEPRCNFQKRLLTFLRSRPRPSRQCSLGSSNGSPDVFRCTRLNTREQFAGRRVVLVDGLAAVRPNPPAADEMSIFGAKYCWRVGNGWDLHIHLVLVAV